MNSSGHRYFIINKPYKMVSQFVSPDKVRLLGALDFDFPEGTHAIGRLDNDSEGLLILTTNKKVTKLLFESKTPHKRTYLVQVRNVMSAATFQHLKAGVSIRIGEEEQYMAVPEEVTIVDKPANLIPLQENYREDIPETWLSITLTEGKFHQVRKMVNTLNHRCKRLIRVSIEDILLGDLASGAVREMEEGDFFRQLKINYPV